MSGDGGAALEPVELPVWIGGCQKWVTGLTRRTTCDDIIYALLAHDQNPHDPLDVGSCAIYERWRDVERPLRGRTKILKVWRAWGADRHSVKFSVRKVTDVLDRSCEMSRAKKTRRPQHTKERERRNRDSHRERQGWRERSRTATQQDFYVRSEYKHLLSNGHLHAPGMAKQEGYKAQAFHDLVQRIISQEKCIQEQITRLRETDVQIDNYETKMHMLRMKENGQNYVQEAYLKEASESSSGSEELFPAIKANDLEAYGHMCDNILTLQGRIEEEQAKLEEISVHIQDETLEDGRDCSDFFAESLTDTLLENVDNPSMSAVYVDEIQKLRAQLDRSASLSAAQQVQLQLVTETLDECDYQIQRRRAHLHSLLTEIAQLDGDQIVPVVTFDTVNCSYPWAAQDNPTSFPSARVEKIDKSRKDSGIDDNFDNEPSRQSHRWHYKKETFPDYNLSNSSVTLRSSIKACRSMENVNTSNHFSEMEYYVTKVHSYRDINKQIASDNDSTSDTGLSSLHSEDSPPILETLV